MTVGTALFLALALAIVCVFLFALIIYMREFNREEKLVQDAIKAQENYYAGLNQTLKDIPIVYLDVPAKKTKVVDTGVAPAPKTNKKNIN